MATGGFSVGDRVRLLAVPNWPTDWNVSAVGSEHTIKEFRDKNPEGLRDRGAEAVFEDNHRPWPVANLEIVK